MRKTSVLTSAIAIVLLQGLAAQAAMLTPGGITPLTAPALAPSGTILQDTGLQFYSFAASSGLVREIVLQDANNTFGKNDLTFMYQFIQTGGDIGSLSGANFTGASLNAFQQAGASLVFGAGSQAATQAGLSADGSTPRFDFQQPQVPGISNTLIIETNATNYVPGTIGLIDGGGQTLNGFAPSVSVPEPASLVLFGFGGASLAAYGWKRRRVSA